jgi:outer membrane lipoprotein-sorting protein
MNCGRARVELSARLDGEVDPALARDLDAHLERCDACRREEATLRQARRAVRIQPVGRVPDLTTRIMRAIDHDGARLRSRSEWAARFKVAAVAACISALVLAGASLPLSNGQGDVASAGEIADAVSSAARSLKGYRASFDIVERGWHPKLPQRHFSAEVWFDAPESFRMLVTDFTSYPDEGWPRNNVEVVATPRKWSIEEPTEWQCPLSALRPCALREQTPSESRTIVDRQPFDGTSHLPTDLIVPLETLVSSEGFDVVGPDTVAGRATYELELTYADAIPLVDALQAGGSWRPFNPSDHVRLWIDRRTWFPLRFEVVAAGGRDRAAWADRLGLPDRPGQTLLSVEAASFSATTSFPRATFEVPTRGLVKSGGFDSGAPPAAWVPQPRYLAGLDAYRSGRTESGQTVRSYSRGMTWLKVTAQRLHPPKPFFPATAELIRVPGGGAAYYQPGSAALGRRMDVYADRVHVHLETNLPRAELVKVAASLGVVGNDAPATIERAGSRITRLEYEDPYGRAAYAREPTFIPSGYDLTSATLARARDGRSTLTTYYRGSEADYSETGLRITQSHPVRSLTPSSRDFLRVTFGSVDARWAPDSGQLEWLEEATYRSVTVPFADLSTAVAVARSLR